MDFRHFDRVCTPVMIVSAGMDLIYVNNAAKRQYPILASADGLHARYPPSELEQIAKAIKGNAVSVSYDRQARLSLTFDPVITPAGEVEYSYLYVSYDSDGADKTIPLFSDSEILNSLERYVTNPINQSLRQLQVYKDNPTKFDENGMKFIIEAMRLKMLRMSMFFSRMGNSFPQKDTGNALCDAAAVLAACGDAFKVMKYKRPEVASYIPVERDVMILLFSDVLSTLYFRLEKPKITVTIENTEEEVIIKFSCGPMIRSLDEPCLGEDWGIDLGNTSIRRRVEMHGGSLNVRSRGHNGATFTLTYPRLTRFYTDPVMGDPFSRGRSLTEQFVVQYLKTLASGEIKISDI